MKNRRLVKKMCLLVTVVTIICNGCGIQERIETSSSRHSGSTAEKVVDCIFENDAEYLYDMFAPCVQEDKDELADDIQTFIDFFEGDYVEMDRGSGHESEGRDHYSATYTYTITTTEKKYYILLKDCDKNDDDSKNGIVSLGVQEVNDYEKEGCLHNSMEGAYVVTEDNHEEIEAYHDHILGRDVIVAEVTEEYFPDEALRNYIKENFDDDVVDGKLSKYEVSYNEDILLDGTPEEKSKIKSLEGIEYLEGLTRIRVNYSDVSEIDVSHNPNLEVLAIEHTNIKSVDLSSCPDMRIMECTPGVEVKGYDGILHERHKDK